MITSPEKKAAKAKPMVSAMDFACLYSNILCIFGGIFLWGVYLGVLYILGKHGSFRDFTRMPIFFSYLPI